MIEFFHAVINADYIRQNPHCGSKGNAPGVYLDPPISGVRKIKCNSPDCKVIDWDEEKHYYCPSSKQYNNEEYDKESGADNWVCECPRNQDTRGKRPLGHYFPTEILFPDNICPYCWENCNDV